MKANLNDEAVQNELIARIIAGEGVEEICRDKHMPSHETVYCKMAGDETFLRRIAHAREQQQEAVCEKMVDLAYKATPEDWQVRKLQINTLQWRAARLAPKKYGDKITQENTGSMTLTVNTGVPRKAGAIDK